MKALTGVLVVLIIMLAVPAIAQTWDPGAWGTTGLFAVPRASTLHKAEMSVGVFNETLCREEGSTNVEHVGIVGAVGVNDRMEIFGSYEPRVGIVRDYLVERHLGQPDLSAPRLNDHPLAVEHWKTGGGDLRLGTKYKLIGDPMEYGGLAAAAMVKFPTADHESGIGRDSTDFMVSLIGSGEMAETVGLNGFAGYNFVGDPDGFELANEFLWGGAVNIPTRTVLQGVFEVFGVKYAGAPSPAPHFTFEDQAFVQGGLRLSLSGFAISGGVNKALGIDDTYNLSPETIGSFLMLSFSTGKGERVSYQSTEPIPAPPANLPPTITCRVERTSINPGESVRVMATTNDPDGDPVTVTWTTTAGALSATTGNDVTWSSQGMNDGTATIGAMVDDGYGGTARCETKVTVIPPPPPPQPVIRNYSCSEFKSRSARIDNKCKAVLDDVALQLRNDARATVDIVGYGDSLGKPERIQKAAQERADNAAKFLVETHKIDASRITTRSGGADNPIGDNKTAAGRAQNRRVEIVVTVPAP